MSTLMPILRPSNIRPIYNGKLHPRTQTSPKKLQRPKSRKMTRRHRSIKMQKTMKSVKNIAPGGRSRTFAEIVPLDQGEVKKING